MKAAKQEVDERAEREAEAARQAEIERVAAIETRIKDMRLLTDGLINATAKIIQSQIDSLTDLPINAENFGEFIDAAQDMADAVGDKLAHALAERRN